MEFCALSSAEKPSKQMNKTLKGTLHIYASKRVQCTQRWGASRLEVGTWDELIMGF